jgi:hypothetical protein
VAPPIPLTDKELELALRVEELEAKVLVLSKHDSPHILDQLNTLEAQLLELQPKSPKVAVQDANQQALVLATIQVEEPDQYDETDDGVQVEDESDGAPEQVQGELEQGQAGEDVDKGGLPDVDSQTSLEQTDVSDPQAPLEESENPAMSDTANIETITNDKGDSTDPVRADIEAQLTESTKSVQAFQPNEVIKDGPEEPTHAPYLSSLTAHPAPPHRGLSDREIKRMQDYLECIPDEDGEWAMEPSLELPEAKMFEQDNLHYLWRAPARCGEPLSVFSKQGFCQAMQGRNLYVYGDSVSRQSGFCLKVSCFWCDICFATLLISLCCWCCLQLLCVFFCGIHI